MRTIYLYEMKRVLCNKLFAAMLLITCAYSYVVLNNTIVLGVAYTAPFSQWSFGAYIGSVAMLLMAGQHRRVHPYQVRRLRLGLPDSVPGLRRHGHGVYGQYLRVLPVL